MIKITKVEHLHGRVLRVEFSDGSSGDYDLSPLIARDTSLTRALTDDDYFARYFIELGALAWPNGLELAPASVHRNLKERNLLRPPARVA